MRLLHLNTGYGLYCHRISGLVLVLYKLNAFYGSLFVLLPLICRYCKFLWDRWYETVMNRIFFVGLTEFCNFNCIPKLICDILLYTMMQIIENRCYLISLIISNMIRIVLIGVWRLKLLYPVFPDTCINIIAPSSWWSSLLLYASWLGLQSILRLFHLLFDEPCPIPI